jgi:thiamine biosynthesis lipoprotein
MALVSGRSLLLLLVACLLLLALLLARRETIPGTVPLEGKTMGTTWSVVLGRVPPGFKGEELQPLLQQQLDRVNRLMSTYDPDSEVSRFNDSRSSDWFPVSAETAAVVELAQETSRLSSGAFDVTVGPLVDLWGFGPRPRNGHRPADAEIEAARRAVGYTRLQVRRSPAALRKDNPDLRIDLSAIAKGYAVDQLAETLRSRGIRDMVVEIGGEMRIPGQRPDGTPWRIAVERPDPGPRQVERVFQLAETGMATSGDYRNFFTEDGQRYAHTMDPATGRPVRHRLASATVLDPSCARADALATTLMVLGEEKAQEFCRRHGIAAYLLIHQGEGTRPVMTDAFSARFGRSAP